MQIYPGAERPYLGNVVEMLKYDDVVAKSKEPVSAIWSWLVHSFDKGESDKYPALMLVVLGKPLIIMQDPEMIRDLQVTKNQITDKTGFMNEVA